MPSVPPHPRPHRRTQIASESHFSILWGSDPSVNEETASAAVFRAFRKHDTADNQFIASDKLGAVLTELQLPIASDARAVQELATRLDSGGCGIIVWAEFWQVGSAVLLLLQW